MKIVHFSTGVNAFSANTRLHTALQKEGIESCIYTRGYEGLPNASNVKRHRLSFAARVTHHLNKIQERRIIKGYRLASGMPFSVGKFGVKATKLETVRKADIIHLHWICDFLSPRTIRMLVATGKPVVWTCHDSWPFTGGCHVRYGCEKYRQECGKCPILHSDQYRDATYRILLSKKRYLAGQPITFIAPSNWMKEHITKSGLFGDCNCYVIPNAVDIECFRKMRAEEIQELLGYQKESGKIHMLFGATSVDIPYKGFEYLAEMLKILREKYPEIADKTVLHIIGNGDCNHKIPAGYQCISWGYIKAPSKMAALYSLADLFLYPSIDDNLPNMVMESLACATPVVAFSTGGIPDMVIHKQNGYIARYQDPQDLAEGFLWTIQNNGGNSLGNNGRQKVVTEFSEKTIAQKHIRLYRALLS